MTGVQWSDFADFYAAIHDGARPFAWQQRLIDGLAETGAWPDVVSAPTGAGKSVPVIAHVFANAAAASTGVRVPRRLVTVVNRRALVDAQHDQALRIQRRLAEAKNDPLLLRIRAALEALTPRPKTLQGGFDVVQMRGGLPSVGRWVDDPAVCAVIAATPDMWGSRLLFGGYGTGRFARPREAGLFAYDCVAALDETHLNRQLAVTALRVRELAGRHADALGVPALQVMRLSATQSEEAPVTLANGGPEVEVDDLGVVEADLQIDAALGERLRRPKPVTYSASPQWPGAAAASKRHVAHLAEAVLDVRKRISPTDGVAGTVGCIVNRVETASAVAEALRAQGLKTVVWVGRMRPYDLAQARAKNPGLFSVAGDDSIDVLVATSTVEVGVDIDLAGLVTELCSGTSLTQRVGRVNRLGRRASAPVTVVGPAVDEAITADVRPHSAEDLTAARAWVLRRADDDAGVAPWSLREAPAPGSTLPRVLLERLEPGIAEILADTSEGAWTELGLDRWLHDEFEEDRDPVLLVPRRFGRIDKKGAEQSETTVPIEDNDLLPLAMATPVLDPEAFPATYRQAVFFVEGILSGDLGQDPRVVDATDPDAPRFVEDAAEVRPGKVYLVPDDVRLSRQGVVVDHGLGREKPAPVFWGPTTRPGDADLRPWLDVGADGLLDGEGLVLFQGETAIDGTEWCDELAVFDDDELLAERLKPLEAAEFEALIPLRGPAAEKEQLPWVVLLPKRDLTRDEEARQEWTTRAAGVALHVHQQHVGERAEALARALHLLPTVAAALREAGAHHDDGKRAPGFQAMLRDGMTAAELEAVADVLLAKSGVARGVQLRGRARYILPGWRHEQASVVWAKAVENVDDPLVLRLIGTSHGRGRSGFAHLGASAAGRLAQGAADEAAIIRTSEELFDHGEWERLIERTAQLWGVWGCAYLEAVLRAADCQVSEEGS